ncbi:hypothetical protein BBSC_2270 [Bifidobacterium scardovii JCM 12489 = DSM 13734]|nr:hypothetical protein BBSC_2270 [Bifidobacterium scardovii JCM 12489 = DSM 13734]
MRCAYTLFVMCCVWHGEGVVRRPIWHGSGRNVAKIRVVGAWVLR